MTTNATPEKLTYEAVMTTGGGVDFSPRLKEIAEYLAGGDERVAFVLSLSMATLIEPIEDGHITPDGDDFEDWLARCGLDSAVNATMNISGDLDG